MGDDIERVWKHIDDRITITAAILSLHSHTHTHSCGDD